ncbi:hypothetical protein U729_3191 (plasmid) [Clostridium baratii str. Sullivan]|uniref:Uncharacterized protein n=1 Tax=Clostridium baratii str. Sullivan TaxID=1415775 RepID=A0A0A7G019_9CLOT|nr:hypothetical protein [Clostridium baratii]AIY85203.1 hypothetical protein U729_3191 [Clostridium baratii str. Sullivan]
MSLLSNILSKEDIQENINNTFNLNNTEYFNLADKRDTNSIRCITDNKNILDIILYKDQEKNEYLLDSRLFDNQMNSMLASYLEILDEDLNITNKCIDDVWIYADWVEVSKLN